MVDASASGGGLKPVLSNSAAGCAAPCCSRFTATRCNGASSPPRIRGVFDPRHRGFEHGDEVDPLFCDGTPGLPDGCALAGRAGRTHPDEAGAVRRGSQGRNQGGYLWPSRWMIVPLRGFAGRNSREFGPKIWRKPAFRRARGSERQENRLLTRPASQSRPAASADERQEFRPSALPEEHLGREVEVTGQSIPEYITAAVAERATQDLAATAEWVPPMIDEQVAFLKILASEAGPSE